jgi:hypothetical protein
MGDICELNRPLWGISMGWFGELLSDADFRHFASGALGGVFALLGKIAIDKWNAPHLDVVLPGLLIETVDDYCGRVCISNTGRSSAKKVRVITNLSEPTTVEEIFDMPWSDLYKVFDIMIPSKTRRYVDIFHIEKADKDRNIVFVANNNERVLPYEKFILTFFATAENATTLTKDVLFSKTDEKPWMSIGSARANKAAFRPDRDRLP